MRRVGDDPRHPLAASTPDAWRHAHRPAGGWHRYVLPPWGAVLALRCVTGGLFRLRWLRCDPFGCHVSVLGGR